MKHHSFNIVPILYYQQKKDVHRDEDLKQNNSENTKIFKNCWFEQKNLDVMIKVVVMFCRY